MGRDRGRYRDAERWREAEREMARIWEEGKREKRKREGGREQASANPTSMGHHNSRTSKPSFSTSGHVPRSEDSSFYKHYAQIVPSLALE